MVGISSDDWILATQLQDDRCRYINEVLQREALDKDEKQIQEEYELIDNRVYRQPSPESKWVVPRHARRQVVFQNHDEKGHFGTEQTLKFLNRCHWFPSMRRYVKKIR